MGRYGRRRRDKDEAEHHGRHHAPRKAGARRQGERHLRTTSGSVGVYGPGDSVEHRLDHHDSRTPPMHEVVSIIADSGNVDQRVVAKSEKHRGNDIERGQLSCASSELCNDRRALRVIPVESEAVGHVTEAVEQQHDHVEPGGQSAHADTGIFREWDAKLPIVADLAERRVD